jgi:5-methylcytosine-specific restriction endonuclease McrA
MTKAQYAEYLQSTAWKEKRRLIMQRCRGYCEGCGSAPATQVHHLTYKHVGNELLFELVAVCDPCHDRIHTS